MLLINNLKMQELLINEFVDYIYRDNDDNDDNNDKKIVYLAIGSAHHMARIINGERIIEIQYDQQYPMFLRKLQKKYPDYNIYIILIDPMLEIPCFTVSRKINDGINQIDDMWDHDERYNNIYHHLIDKVHILEFKNSVKYGKYDFDHPDPTLIYINSQLDILINISMIHKWFLIIMEYTGRNLNRLVSSYDNMIGPEKDHIFFGLPTRIEGGCYINLEDSINSYVTNMEKGYLTAFTPFNYNDAQILDLYHKYNKLDDEDSQIISKQIYQSFKIVVQTYKDNVLALFRRMRTHKIEREIGKPGLKFADHEYFYVFNKYKIDKFHEKIDSDINSNINSIVEIMSDINDKEFQYILNFFGKQEVFPIYLENKHNPDPYKMYQGICAILLKICPK